MKKLLADVLILALNKIEFDARLSNFIDTFTKLKLEIASISLDSNEFLSINQNAFFINIPENLRTYIKILEFNRKGNYFLDKIVPKSILCSDIYSLPLGVKFKKKYNVKLIYDSREIYSNLASLTRFPLKQGFLKYFEKYFVRFVDSIIVTGELDRDYLSQVFPSKRFFVIYNYPKKIEKTESVNLRKNLNLAEQDILAIYEGALLEGRGIGVAIESLVYAGNLHLVIAGSGAMKAKYQNISQALNLENRIHFLGEIPYKKLLNYTSECDVGLCLIEPVSFSYNLALPNKLFEYIQANIPVVATNLPAISSILQNSNIGELVEPNIEPKKLAEIIISVAQKKATFYEELQKYRNIYVWDNQENTILELIE